MGEIIAGLIVGPCMLNFVSYDGFISGMAEIGVILLTVSYTHLDVYKRQDISFARI